MNGKRPNLDDFRRGHVREILVAMRDALVRCNARDDITVEFSRLLDEIEDRISCA